MAALAKQPRVMSLIPGRLRFHLPGWTVGEAKRVETALARVEGVRSVRANPLTRNILVQFDCRTTDADALLPALHQAWQPSRFTQSEDSARNGTGIAVNGREPLPSALLRIGVKGLLGQAAVDSLWFAVGFLWQALGLPPALLGLLHVLTDVAVWGLVLSSGSPGVVPRAAPAQADRREFRPALGMLPAAAA